MKIKFVSAIYFIGLNREIMSVKTKVELGLSVRLLFYSRCVMYAPSSVRGDSLFNFNSIK